MPSHKPEPTASPNVVRGLRLARKIAIPTRSIAQWRAMPTLAELSTARDLLSYIAASPTPYHAAAEAAERLLSAGFRPLDEREEWHPKRGARAFIVRGGGTLIAFQMGLRPPAEGGFLIFGAHTDSPNLRLKPRPDVRRHGYLQCGVEVYGGALAHTWLDRALGIAGRVTLKDGRSSLFRWDHPSLVIPSLAIHLDRTVILEGLKLNLQTQLIPICGLGEDDERGFIVRIAEELHRGGATGVAPEEIDGFDLCLFDLEPPRLGGLDDALLLAPRLDNLASCHAGLLALLGCPEPIDATRVLVLHDHEEVGSRSASGAQSRLLLSVLERLARAFGDAPDQATARALARSFLVSCDMAHAVHPNFSDKHDAEHRPTLNAGPVIKVNASQAYATDGPAEAVFERACRRAGFSAQRYVCRNDIACGSTIGPITAARLGIRGIDVGNPMLGMHSCRELAGSADPQRMVDAVGEWWQSGEVPSPQE